MDHEVSFALPMDGPAEWHFSDSRTESGNPVARRFAEPGVYGVQAKRGDAWMEALSVQVMALPEMILPETVHAFPGDRVEIRPAYAPPADMDLIFRWNAGDGTALEGETLRHEYETAGDYNAALTIQGKDGPDCLTKTETVTVNGSIRRPRRKSRSRQTRFSPAGPGTRPASRPKSRATPPGGPADGTSATAKRPLARSFITGSESRENTRSRLTLTDARHHTGRAFSIDRPIAVEKRP